MNIEKFLKKSSIFDVLAVESLFSNDFRNKLSLISKIIIFVVGITLLFSYATQNSQDFSAFNEFIKKYS
jgi:hypothetical protein